jgi:hypothetical protein
MKYLLLITALFSFLSAIAIEDSAHAEKPHIVFSGYSEIYYSYDFSNPNNHRKAGFLYSHNRHNEFNLNLGFLKATYNTSLVRSNIAFMTGTYANANLATEPGVLKNIFEANIGVKISPRKNLWIDAGIMPSHIGFESAHAPSCWSLTRSILAENSPYYECGAKITFITDDEKWLFSALALNGWQHIQRPDGINTASFGTQITFTPHDNITLNSSTFIGDEYPDSVKRMRYFHNFYGIVNIHEKFSLTLGFDIGFEQKGKDSTAFNTWYSPVLVAQFRMSKKACVTLRSEYYSDEEGVLIPTGTPNGFQTMGYSINYDYAIKEYVHWRIEARTFQSRDKIFILNDQPSNENYFLTTSLAITF